MNNNLYLQKSQFNPAFQSRKVSLSRIQDDINLGFKMSEIAERQGVSTRTLYYRITKFNLLEKRDIIDKKIQDALPLIKSGELSQKEISKRTGLSRYMISKIISEYFPISPYKQKKEALKLAVQTSLSSKEIAEQFNTNIHSVKKLRLKLHAGNKEKKKSEYLKQILEMKANGKSNVEIAKELKVHRTTVSRLLKNVSSIDLIG